MHKQVLIHMTVLCDYINYRNARLGMNQMQLLQVADANTHVLNLASLDYV